MHILKSARNTIKIKSHTHMITYLHTSYLKHGVYTAHIRRKSRLEIKPHTHMITYLHTSYLKNCHLGWRTLVLKCNKNNYD